MNNPSRASAAVSARTSLCDRRLFRSGDSSIVSLGRVFAVAFILASAGCEDDPAKQRPNASAPSSGAPTESTVVSTEPARVELQDAKAVLDDLGIIRFEIDYRFTSGKPRKHYVVEIRFPGTDYIGAKPINPGELDPEGTIKTGIEVGDRPVDTYEITLSEADSPQQGYTLISNTLTGTVKRGEDQP